MLTLALLAATLYVCPGEVFSDVPKEGCKPFHQSEKEGFSTIQQAPHETSHVPSAPAPAESMSAPIPAPAAPSTPSGNSEICAMYSEYLHLTQKVTGGQMGNSPEDVNRYEQLRNIFGVNARPNCP